MGIRAECTKSAEPPSTAPETLPRTMAANLATALEAQRRSLADTELSLIPQGPPIEDTEALKGHLGPTIWVLGG